MKAPVRIEPQRLGDYLEVMSKAAFQTGISWKVVENKWPGIKEALRDFDPVKIAQFSDKDIDDLTQDTRVIRNRRKLQAIVANARRLIELEEEHGSFKDYLRSHESFEDTVKNLRKEFKFLGNTGAYFFLHVVGEEVPSHEEWMASNRQKK